jgi:putative flippase GtrA
MLLVILVEVVGTDAVIASTAGALLGATINYFFNYRITFKSRTNHRITLPRFLTVATIGFLINTPLMWVAVHLINLHYILGQVTTTSLVLLWNFTGNRYWTFSEEQNDTKR